jgi:hypothetical protein
VLVKRIGMGGDLDPLSAAGDHRQHVRETTTDMLCCNWAMYFSAAAVSEK